jgi:acetyl-CoA decarbonylase/synthase, CODH/ACS complex subunit delta
MAVTVEAPIEKWSGNVRSITLGATAAEGGTRDHTVEVGGASALPYLAFEGKTPNRPKIAIEVRACSPVGDWPEPLVRAWGAVLDDPAAWAKAAEDAGADLIVLQFGTTDATGQTMTANVARKVLRTVLQATGLPLLVFGPGQVELDNELMVAVAEEGVGERLVLGPCEDKNYRTIVAAALAHNHLVTSRTPMDVNLAKQSIILIHDMGLPMERILMDPTTGALGYGMEYGYSVMERLRLAALQGDGMTQQPMMVTPGEEAWRTKEARAGEGVPASWGEWSERAANWETITAAALVESGADVLVLRHPESVSRVRRMIDDLMEGK